MEKKISSQVVYDGKIIKVYQDKVECPNGKIASREVVRHHGGVGIVGVINNKILLVKQYRYAYTQDLLEIPAGKLEKGEDAYQAGLRELEEETGYSCKDLTLITQMYPTVGYCDEIIHIYQGHDLFKVDNPLQCDDDEFINIIEVDIDEAYQMVLNQEIHDSKTIIAIMYIYNQKHA